MTALSSVLWEEKEREGEAQDAGVCSPLFHAPSSSPRTLDPPVLFWSVSWLKSTLPHPEFRLCQFILLEGPVACVELSI